MYLSIHFDQFLNVRVDSVEKKAAYEEIVQFLDNVNMSKEMREYLEELLPLMDKEEMKNMDQSLLNSIEDMDNYVKDNKKSLEEYIKFRTSEKYKETAAYKIQKLIVEFQQSNGYEEIFLTNLKILSEPYREYSKKLNDANEFLIKKYPQF